MGEIALRNDEKVGLAAAVVLHGALVAVLLMQTVRTEVSVFPERMTVSLATEVGLEAAAPDPVAESRASIAPTLSPEPAPAPEPQPAPPERVERAPAPQPRPQPSRAARPTPTPTQFAPSRDRSRPDRTPAPRASSAPAPRPTSSPAPTRTANSGGGSRIGDDFLEGKGSSTTTTETRAPAAQIGAAAKASIGQALARQVKPHWTAPQGVDVDLLVTLVDFDLNPDGTLKGRPRLRSQSGVNDSNRAQAARHAENAIRAVQLAAPFNLPEEYYEAWKTVRGARFDRNTSR
ncbi:outer membrane biosynthesis protein TonB [Erythromicrobium ramosum]|uniref:Energy transducer TonB n=1 Tax=Erythrobacter ramosus TaxID=35811 RepID=A0A6I4ULG1_9SPHN|nr:TonB C-terminal domain-containing protein [Erythrobacter ramosus]MBB3774085.1 outer membrane biosynthesis protein TonB [Erythrobacter ramosus]MXP38253.1 energy transducer TonB [Erythrobacter ramosus]